MPLNKYRVLSKIAETGKMHEAAQELIYSKQNLSRITKTMEEEYGFPLFVRTRDGVQLTENARRMLPAINKIIEAEDELHEIINSIQEDEGLIKHIHIGACGSTVIGLVQESIKRMKMEHEELSVDVRYFIDAQFFMEDLNDGSVDFCIVVDKYQRDFDFEPFMKERFYAVLPKDHELATRDEISYIELMDYPVIATPDCPWSEEIRKKDRWKFVTIDDDIIGIPVIERNEAIGILAAITQYDYGPNLVAIPIKEEMYRAIGVATSKDRELSSAAKRFKSILIKTAEEYFK